MWASGRSANKGTVPSKKPVGADPWISGNPYAVVLLILDFDGNMAEFGLASCPAAWPRSARELALWQFDGR